MIDLRQAPVQQDSSSIRIVDDLYEQSKDREQFVRFSGGHTDTMEYASDSSNESYKEICVKQMDRS